MIPIKERVACWKRLNGWLWLLGTALMVSGWSLQLQEMTSNDDTSAEPYIMQLVVAVVDWIGWLFSIGSARPCNTTRAAWLGRPSEDSKYDRFFDVNYKTPDQPHLHVDVGGVLVPVESLLLTHLPPAIDLTCCHRYPRVGRTPTPPIQGDLSSFCACQARDLVEGHQDEDSAQQGLACARHRDIVLASELHAIASTQLESRCWNNPLCCSLRLCCCMGPSTRFTVPANANHGPATPAQREERLALRARVDVHYALLRKQCVSSTMARLTLASALVVFMVGLIASFPQHFAVEGVSTASMARKFQLAVVLTKALVGSLPNLARLGIFGSQHCCTFSCSTTLGHKCRAAVFQQLCTRSAGAGENLPNGATAQRERTGVAGRVQAAQCQYQSEANIRRRRSDHASPLCTAAARVASGRGVSQQSGRLRPHPPSGRRRPLATVALPSKRARSH